MHLQELTLEEFNDFIKNSPLSTHYQTRNYALLMGEHGYDYEFIGLINEYNQIKAASMILLKTIKYHTRYGYAPKGFILDYFNEEIVKEFTEALKNYYKKKHVIFIKINPEIAISELDSKTGIKTYNWNYDIKEILEKNNYIKLKDNLYFESLLPRFSAIVSLKNYEMKKVNKNTRNKINRGMKKGLHLELAKKSGIDILNNFIKKKRKIDDFYYKDYYNVFERDEKIDLFLVSINKEEFLINSRKLYEKELEKNNHYNNLLEKENTKKNINKKMDSDRKLLFYLNDVELATKLNKKSDKLYIAGALVMKHQNRIHILISGYDKKYSSFDANYFLHHEILNYYKEKFDYADLNGFTGDFTNENPYIGLNKFKLGFNPKIYEYIGEYDLPIKEKKYIKLRTNGELAKIFNKKDKKIEMGKKND